MIKKLLIFSLIVIVPSCGQNEQIAIAQISAMAADCYVATNGNDNNLGTSTSPKQHIQSCIDYAIHDGDVVQVAPGTYNENLQFTPNVGISLIGSPHDPSLTVIDGQYLDHVINIPGATIFFPIKDYIVQGFTLQHGVTSVEGGGISSSNAGLRLQNMIIKDNRAENCGGVSVANNPISDPTIYNGDAYLDNVVVANNHAHFDHGACITGGGPATIRHSKFILNTPAYGIVGGAGGMYLAMNDSVFIDNSLFALNKTASNCGATMDGAGLGLRQITYGVTIVNTTIANNDVVNTGSGAGLVIMNSDVVLINSILWENTDANGTLSQIGFPLNFGPPPAASQTWIVNSDIQGGLTGIPADVNNIVNWLNGNIDADPLFVDISSWQTGGFSIQPLSPAVNTGVAQYTISGMTYTAPVDDIDNTFRPMGAAHDMGAYEVKLPPAPHGQIRPAGHIVFTLPPLPHH